MDIVILKGFLYRIVFKVFIPLNVSTFVIVFYTNMQFYFILFLQWLISVITYPQENCSTCMTLLQLTGTNIFFPALNGNISFKKDFCFCLQTLL